MSGQTYTTMGTVSSSALLGGLVDLDVLDDKGAGVKTLGIGVGLGVLQELQEELGGLDGPSGTGDTPLLAYTSCSVSLTSIRDDHRDLISTVAMPRWYSIEAHCEPECPSSLHRPSGICLPPHHHFSKYPMSPVTGCVRLCRIVRTLRSTADGASVAAEGDDLLLLLDVLKELDGALQLPAVDGLGGLAGVLERNTEVGTAGLGRLGGRDLGGSVANLWVERVNVTISTVASPFAVPPCPRRNPQLHAGFPNFRQPGALGEIGNSLVLGLENRCALTILTVLMWRWCRRRRWVMMVVYGSGWLGSFLLV